MEIIDLKRKLDTLGIPTAYRVFKEEVALPFIVFYQDKTTFTSSDSGYKYLKERDYSVHLYTDIKDEELEQKLEDILCCELTKDEGYIASTQMYVTKYEFSEVQKCKRK